MSVIVVDIGNTRIKWARAQGARPGATRAATHAGWKQADYARRLLTPAPGERAFLHAIVAPGA